MIHINAATPTLSMAEQEFLAELNAYVEHQMAWVAYFRDAGHQDIYKIANNTGDTHHFDIHGMLYRTESEYTCAYYIDLGKTKYTKIVDKRTKEIKIFDGWESQVTDPNVILTVDKAFNDQFA